MQDNMDAAMGEHNASRGFATDAKAAFGTVPPVSI